MKPGRRHQRFIRRLETEFSANDQHYRGISSDFSHGGLFVRTSHAFAPGAMVDLLVRLPDGNEARLKGRVRRALKTSVAALKNGMGIEIIEKDQNYSDFITSLSPDEQKAEKDAPSPAADLKPSAAPEFVIIPCGKCGIRNKVNKLKLSLGPKCGKCGNALNI